MEDITGAALSQHLGHDVRKSNILEKQVLLALVCGRTRHGRPWIISFRLFQL